MKKLLLSLVLLCAVAFTAQAQEIGSKWVSGSAGVWSTKTGNGKRMTNYNIVPEMGFVVGENLGVGVKLGFTHDDEYALLNQKVKVDIYEINPFVRYTFAKGNIGALFVDGGVGYGYVKLGGLNGDSFDIGLRPGVAFNVSDNISLIGTFGFLGYQSLKVKSYKSDAFGLNFDLSEIQLGVSFIF